jgi:hypothetical protein
LTEEGILKRMRLKDYLRTSWPPMPGGSFTRYQEFPVDQRVSVAEVFPSVNAFVTFTCEFRGSRPTYDLPMKDQGLAEEFSRLLSRHIGTTLEQFGELPLDY